MKINVIYSLLVGFSLLACTKEDDLSPSRGDVNWCVVTDDPSDELTHLRYTIYKETGVSIFYNDTLGSEVRHDVGGNAYKYYEVVRLGYTLTSVGGSSTKYTLEENREDIKMMVELLNKYTIPLLTPQIHPRCFLITDTLTEKIGGSFIVNIAGFRDDEATCVGWAKKVKGMTEEEKKRLGAEIVGEEINRYLKKIGGETKEYEAWTTVVLPRVSFGGFIYKNVLDPKAYGLLSFAVVFGNNTYAVSLHTDISNYVGLIYCHTDAEIREMYKEWPRVIAKYECMKKLMEKHGFLKTN